MFCLLTCLAFSAKGGSTNDQPHLIAIVGAAGEQEYGESFAAWAMRLKDAAGQDGARFTLLGMGDPKDADDRSALQKLLAKEAGESPAELWLVLIGHGTFDGREAKFNARGPDITDTELAEWLEPVRRPVAVINCTSASAPFMKSLARNGRVVITATKSGSEQNYTRFGDFFTAALAAPDADLDKDGQTSLLETFIVASKRVAEFYEGGSRLATEHALLDDNGDGLGTRADWFRGVRAVKRAEGGATVDGFRAHQFHLVRSEFERRLPAGLRQRRDALELAVNELREHKSGLPEPEYFSRLEALMLDLARLYQQAEAAGKPEAKPAVKSGAASFE